MPQSWAERKVFGHELDAAQRVLLWHALKVMSAIVLPFVFLAVIVPTGAALWIVHRDAERQIDTVNLSRAQVLYSTCIDQNSRHDATIRRLDEVIVKTVQKHPERAAAIKESRDSTVFLIDALAPSRNCKALVRNRFGFVPPTRHVSHAR